MREKWRLLFSEPATGAENMAVDEALFNLSPELKKQGYDGTLRFYFWEPPCISLGYFQRAEEALNLKKCKELNIGVTKRITGGGAIYHSAEITYSLTTALSSGFVPSNVDESYGYLEDFIVQGFKVCGGDVAYRSKATPHAKNFYCFVRPSKYDLVASKKEIGGKKVVGSAQRRSGDRFLQHGSMLLNLNDSDKMFSILKLDCSIAQAKAEFKENVTTLDEITGKNLDKYEVCMRLIASFEKAYNVILVEDELTEAERKLAEELREKYRLG